jgi:hypothetical protein
MTKGDIMDVSVFESRTVTQVRFFMIHSIQIYAFMLVINALFMETGHF